MREYIKYVILSLGLIGFIVIGVTNIKHTNEKLQINEIELKSKETQLIELNQRYDKVLELKTDTEKEKEEQLKQIQELEADRERLQQELQAKLDKQQAEQEKIAQAAKKATGTATAQAATGNCASWIQAAGITEVNSAVELIRRESGCNPNAINRSSGACGVAQELPCGKSGCSLGDGACQVRWMNSYVQGRYGSWTSAVAFHNANNWY